MTTEIEITCKMQRDMQISPEWCDLVQYQQICRGCRHNLNRTRSRWIEKHGSSAAAPSREKRRV